LGAAGCTFIMGIPGSDDIMLNYQTTSFHDALYVRRLLNLRPAPEFESWLQQMGIFETGERPGVKDILPEPFSRALTHLPAEARP
jgi:ethanolamine ammonia-lyase large subunit